MSIIWLTGNQLYYLNIIMKIVCNPDAMQRILDAREKGK
jgi:hypothetical protein